MSLCFFLFSRVICALSPECFSDVQYIPWLLMHVNRILISSLNMVLYGCETWSLTLREEHRLRVFENRVLRGIFGPKGDEVIGCWRKLHNVLFAEYN
jgi:hypothetical protein